MPGCLASGTAGSREIRTQRSSSHPARYGSHPQVCLPIVTCVVLAACHAFLQTTTTSSRVKLAVRAPSFVALRSGDDGHTVTLSFWMPQPSMCPQLDSVPFLLHS